MSATIIDGRAIADAIHRKTKLKVAALKKRGIVTSLHVVMVGSDKPSQTYVRKKQEAAEAVGISFTLHTYPASIQKDHLLDEIKKIQASKPSGLIIQLPLPERLYSPDIINAIDPVRDVDCMTHENMGRLIMNDAEIVPPTPGAVFSVLDSLGVNPTGKTVTIVGMGALVGKPLAVMMANARASVTTCNSATQDIAKKCREADILVSGVGKKDLIRGGMVKKGAIVIDTGICFDNGKMYGDANMAEMMKKASAITPTPGGIGPITVARLLANTAQCAANQHKKIPR